jgi:hypothetical protein
MSNKFGLPESLLDAVKKIQTEETEYQMKVKALMKKKGITSLSQLSPDEKKAFFNTLDSMHQAKNEEANLDEAKKPVSKEDVTKLLIKYGNNPQSAKKMVDKEFASAVKRHPEATASKIAEVIRSVAEEVEINEMDKSQPSSSRGAEGVPTGKKANPIKTNKLKQDALKTLYKSYKDKKVKEDVELEEGKSGTGYELYHKDFSSAMAHAYDFAKKKYNIEVDPQEIDRNVAMGPKKPSSGKANAYRLLDKTGKKAIQVQVTNLDNKRYELNMYKEDLDEERDLPFTPDKPKKNPGVVPGKRGVGPSIAKHLAKMAMKKQQQKKSIKEEDVEEKYVNPGLEKLAAQRRAMQQQKKPIKKEELEEGMSSAQVAKLRQEYEKIGKIDPASDNYKKLTAMLDKLDIKTLQQLAGAKIKFVSGLAQNRVVRKMNEEEALEESGGPVVWKKGNDHIEKYGDEKFALYKDGKKTKYYKSMDDAKAALEEAKDEGASKKKETEFHTKLDKLVHKTFGKSPDEKKMKEEVEEASSPAQQAAIAISMKKAGKKPKEEGVMIPGKMKSTGANVVKKIMAEKKEMKKEATGKEKPVKSGEKISNKKEPITIDPEVDEKN